MKWGPAFGLFLFLLPSLAFAQIANFVFTSDPQTVDPGIPSQAITIQAQGNDGASVGIPSTACISVTSTSPEGQFSSSASTWKSVAAITMSKNTSNKNFYYEDAAANEATLTVQIALKPESVSDSCTNWPLDEWNIQWTATQAITVGVSGGSNSQTNQSGATSTIGSTSQAPAQAKLPAYVPPPPPSLYADAGVDRTVIVGADVEFDGSAYDKDQNPLDPTTVRFLWNFGDGATAEGPAVLHHFSYPGRYAVTLTIGQNKTAVADEAVVTAEPAALSFLLLSDGGVEIENLAGHDLDLSQWIVRQSGGAFSSQFILPTDSKILSDSSMEVSPQTLQFRASSSTLLEYPNGVSVLAIGQTTASASSSQKEAGKIPQVATRAAALVAAPSAPARTAAAPPSKPAVRVSVDQTDDSTQDSADSNTVGTTSSSTTVLAQTAAAAAPKSDYLWWLGIIALALATGAAGAAAKHFKKREWDIVEDAAE